MVSSSWSFLCTSDSVFEKLLSKALDVCYSFLNLALRSSVSPIILAGLIWKTQLLVGLQGS